MAYARRRKFNLRRTYRKSKGGYNWGNLAKKAFKTAKYVASLVNAETKIYYTELAATAPTYTGILNTLNTPAQGVQSNQREGDSVKGKKLVIKGKFTYGGGNSEECRLIVFLDKQNVLTSSNVLRVPATQSLIVFQPKNEETFYNSNILFDRTFIVNSSTKYDSPFRIKIPLNIHTDFQSAGTTIVTNAIRILCFSQTNVGGATVQYTTEYTYVDN